VGDQVRIGPPVVEGEVLQTGGEHGCVLEVSIPRQPCFKLNQRFGIKNFAPKTFQNFMTGWYYRVVEEGWIAQGMEMRVTERRNPGWTIKKCQEFVHGEKKFNEEMHELLEMPELGDECKDVFKELFAKQKEEEERARRPPVKFRNFKLAEKTAETKRISRFKFEAVEAGEKIQKIRPGSNVLLKLPNGLQRAYSVIDGDSDSFILGIAKEEASRGGSVYLHDSTHVGDTIEVGPITYNLGDGSMASHHIFIIGGIGITAFLAPIERLKKINCTYEVHNAVRSVEDIAFASNLKPHLGHVKTYDKSKGERLDIEDLLKNRTWNSHVWVCGPQRMIDAVLETGKKLDMPDEEIHYENFKVQAGGDPFTVQIETPDKGCKELKVGEHQSLLEALKEAGFDIGSSCETGSCGTCRIPLRKGKVDHKGTALTEDEKKVEILTCVSRGMGEIVVGLPDADDELLS
jgi:ferredoxin-NADP reductase